MIHNQTTPAPVIIFYSWESDLPNRTNRTLIEQALKGAVDRIGKDEQIESAPRLDKDTQGIPGAPAIDSTILKKIDESDIFVGDVSIVTGFELNERTGRRRPSPNPNVMFELGYALRAHGESHIVLLANTAFGPKEDLPFDIGQRRILLYDAPQEADDLSTVRKELVGRLVSALTDIVADVLRQRTTRAQPEPTPENMLIAELNARSPQVDFMVRKYMNDSAQAISTLMPNCQDERAATSLDAFVNSLAQTLPMTRGFLGVAEQIVITNNATGLQAAKTLYRSFGQLFDLFQTPRNMSGRYFYEAFNLPQFIAREWLTALFALLLREERWDLIAALLNELIPVSNDRNHERSFQDFTYATHHMTLIERLAIQHGLLYASEFGALLRQRNESLSGGGPVGPTFEQMIEADYFLYFAAQMRLGDSAVSSGKVKFYPACSVYLSHVPTFLEAAKHISLVSQQFPAYKVASVEEMRQRYIDNVLPLISLYGRPVMEDPREAVPPYVIGSKP